MEFLPFWIMPGLFIGIPLGYFYLMKREDRKLKEMENNLQKQQDVLLRKIQSLWKGDGYSYHIWKYDLLEMDLDEFVKKWGGRNWPKKDPLEGFTKPDWEQMEEEYQDGLKSVLLSKKPKFKVGQWVRIPLRNGNNLGVIKEIKKRSWGYTYFGKFSEGSFYRIEEEDMQAAFPQKCEWWRYGHCYRVLHESSEPFRVIEWNEKNTDWTGMNCCLEPVNFGKGEKAIFSHSTEETVIARENTSSWIDDLKFKVGQWVRFTGGVYKGDLAIIDQVELKGILLKRSFAATFLNIYKDEDLSEIELAFPRKGEFWNYLQCVDHPKLRNIPRLEWKFDSHEAPSHVIKSIKELLRCECLVPENFGKGEQA